MQRVEQVSYKYYSRCYRISNELIDRLVTGEFGPRFIRFGQPLNNLTDALVRFFVT